MGMLKLIKYVADVVAQMMASLPLVPRTAPDLIILPE